MKSLFIAADCLAVLSLKMRLVVLSLCLCHNKIQCSKASEDEKLKICPKEDLVDCSSLIFTSVYSVILLFFSSVRPQFRNRLTVSHNEPVTCCGYSEEFRQVVSCTESSVSKVNSLQPRCPAPHF